MNTLGIRISDDMEDALKELCSIKSSIIKEALAEFLEDKKDYYAALEGLKQHKKDGYKTVLWEQVQKENGLLDNE